jgi:general secretion pathway protein D
MNPKPVKPMRDARLSRSIILLLALVPFAGIASARAPRSGSAQQSAPPANPPQQQPALCPNGAPKQKVETPFGPMESCPQASAPVTAAPAPQAAPATPPAPAAPVPQEKPAETAPAETKPADIKPADLKPAEGSGPDGTVSLNLENADLYQVLRILGSELKINYVVDPAVKGSVTINTATTVSRKELFNVLEMILELNGAAAVKSNGYYSIVPLANARQQAMNFHYAKKAEGAPPEEAFSLMVVPMKFMSASEMSKILTPFMSPAGQIVVQEKGNIMLITESAAKLKQLQQIIDVFDDPVLGRQRVHLFPVTNNLAANLIVELRSVFAGYGLTTGSSGIQFVPMDRLNSILAISPSPEVFPEVESWIQKLDQPSRDVGIRNFVYKVQNAKATELRDILNELYGGQSAKAPPAPANPAAENPALLLGPPQGGMAPQTPQAGAATPKAAEGQARVQGELRIMADERNNALIVQSTPHDYDVIHRTLQELDVLPRQVLVDARVYEVALTGDLSFGVSAFLDQKSKLNPLVTTASFSAAQTPALQASTFAVISNTRAIQLFLTANENRSRVKTLSAPSILVTDNTSARVQVGSEIPVPIGSALTPVTNGGTSLFAQSVQYRDTGVILTVTPRVNAGGIVTLTVAQEVSSPGANTLQANSGPVINKSQFQTTVVLKDGQTMALGGIIRDTNSLIRNRVPLLGDIPGVGLLFGSTTRSTTRSELVLLITPHVAEDLSAGAAITDDFVSRMKNMKKDIQKQNAVTR